MTNKKVLSVLIALAILTGCATIVSDSNYSVRVESSVDNVDVNIKNRQGHKIYSVKTPTIVELSAGGGFKSESYLLEFEKEGYISTSKSISSDTDGWFFGNLFLGGLIGMLIDASNGSMYKLPDFIYADMQEDLTYTKEYKNNHIQDIKTQPLLENNKSLEINNSSIEDQIKKLKMLDKLKDMGLITQKEYSEKRSSIINNL